MLLTRRRFLAFTGAGMMAGTMGCKPAWLLNQDSSLLSPDLSLSERAALAQKKSQLLGYPINMNTLPDDFFDWRRYLTDKTGLNTFAYNNVGNPYKKSPIAYSTHDFEREIINRFGTIFGFPGSDTWGFLSNSGTDSNMHGMYMGRSILKGRTGKIAKAYFTKEAHYSVQILGDLLGLDCIMVDTLDDGSMDATDLKKQIQKHSDSPALVVATIGTTFKGAIDPIDRIQQALHGHPSYLHLDAALFGGYLPYTEHAQEIHYQFNSASEPRYDSIAVSCHKFYGFPSPAGLFITTKSNYAAFDEVFSQIHNPEYIHQVPGTITCSRDAVKPAEFYYFSTPAALNRQRADVKLMLANSDYLFEQLQTHLPQLQAQRANKLSNTIYFKKPGQHIIEKYSLATMHLTRQGQQQAYAHVVVMPHVSKKVISDFLTDLKKDAATGYNIS